ncbi:hypothetical protein [Streptomyces luteireticuli]|uniref:hypothetical protein n=1 Tax=Streptomyces luteireticuli TaxID=173858 RepID=UPI003556EDD1
MVLFTELLDQSGVDGPSREPECGDRSGSNVSIHHEGITHPYAVGCEGSFDAGQLLGAGGAQVGVGEQTGKREGMQDPDAFEVADGPYSGQRAVGAGGGLCFDQVTATLFSARAEGADAMQPSHGRCGAVADPAAVVDKFYGALVGPGLPGMHGRGSGRVRCQGPDGAPTLLTQRAQWPVWGRWKIEAVAGGFVEQRGECELKANRQVQRQRIAPPSGSMRVEKRQRTTYLFEIRTVPVQGEQSCHGRQIPRPGNS